MKQHSKSVGALAGGMFATLIVGGLKMNGIVLDPDMASAAAGLASLFGVYFFPANK